MGQVNLLSHTVQGCTILLKSQNYGCGEYISCHRGVRLGLAVGGSDIKRYCEEFINGDGPVPYLMLAVISKICSWEKLPQ